MSKRVAYFDKPSGTFTRRELDKHPRRSTPSRERTTSSRKRAGSRKGNGRKPFWSDNRRTDPGIGWGAVPNHKAREVDITSCWPLMPGMTAPAKR